MNIFKIFEDLETVDADVYDRFSTRRRAMSDFANVGKKLTMAALPLAFGAMFKKAYGKPSADVNDVLQYALYLEHLENEFYKAGLATPTALQGASAAGRGAIQTIQTHEQQHVRFLESVLSFTADQNKPNIDLTGGKGTMTGPFGVVLTSYANFLLAAQLFEDTGVRAYKGRAVELKGNEVVLTAALQIHSVEARHASHIRQMRKALGAANGGADVDPWITSNQGGVPSGLGAITAAGAAIYAGEEKATQGKSNTDIAAATGVSAAAATESFDEPLTPAQVLAIVGTPGAGVGAANAGFFY